ncbi:hypothetical protein DWB84_12030 [Saccharophagus sp. K07]|nr:hypothetical protein [Saccharophagus sp. K07]
MWKRVVRWFLICLVLILVLPAVFVTILLGTESGRLWLIKRGGEFAENAGIYIELTNLRTPSLGIWRADEIIVRRENQILVEVQQLELLWSPSALVDRQLLVHRLGAYQIAYHHSPSAEETPPEEEKSSGEFSSPVRVTLEDLSVYKLDLHNLQVSEQALPSYQISGAADAFGPQYPLQLRLDITSLGAIETALHIDTQALSAQKVRFTGDFREASGGLLGGLIQWPKEQDIEANFAATLEHDAGFFELGLENLRLSLSSHALEANGNLSYTTSSRTLSVSELAIIIDGNRQRLSGSYSPQDLSAQINLDQLPLELAQPWVEDLQSGSVSGDINVTWSHQEEGTWPNVIATVDATATYQQRTYNAKVSGSLLNKLVTLQPSFARLGNTQVEAQGKLDLIGNQSNLSGKVVGLEDGLLRQFNVPIPEELNVRADHAVFTVRGAITDPIVQIDTRLNGQFQKRAFSLTLSGSGSQKSANISNMHLLSEKSEAKASGRLDWTGSSTKLQLQFANLSQDLLQLLPEENREAIPQELTFNASGNLHVSGDLKQPKVQTQSVISGTYARPTESLPYKLSLDGTVQVGQLADLSMALTQVELILFDKPALTLDGHYKASDINLHLHMDGLPTETLAAFGWQRVDGQAKADLQFSGSLQSPVIAGFLEYRDQMPSPGRGRVPVMMRLDLATENEQLNLHAGFTHNNDQVGNLSFSLPLGPYLQGRSQQDLPLFLDAKGELDLRFLRMFVDLGSHRIDGKILTDLTVRGTAAEPEFVGKVQLQQGTYNNSATGSLLEDIRLTLEGDGQTLRLTDGWARSGDDGHLAMSGHIHWSEDKRNQPDAVELTVTADNLILIQRRDLQGELQGDVKVSGSFQELWVKGKLDISPLNASVESAISSRIPEIEVTEIKSEEQDKRANPLPVIHLDITISAERQAYLRGRGLDTELGGRISIRGTATNPEYQGLFTTRRGRIDLFGKRFVLNNGEVRFNNDGAILRIPATYTTEDLTITAELYGTADEPKLKLTSVPARPEDEILSLLIFGKSVQDITAFEAIRLAGAVRTLSSGGGFDPVDSARQMLGVDTLTIDNTSTSEGSGVSVGVGKYINEKVYLEIKRSPNPTQPWNGSVQIELSPKLTLQSGTSENGGAGAELMWKKDY